MKIWTISGRIVDAYGKTIVLPADNFKLFGKRLNGTDDEIAIDAVTQNNGAFGIQFDADDVSDRDFYIRAVLRDQFGMEILSVDSPVVLGAKGNESVGTLVLDARPFVGPSEFSQIKERLDASLGSEGLALGELSNLGPEKLALLAVRADVEPHDVTLMRQAVVCHVQSEQSGSAIPIEAFFGLGRQGISLADLQTVVSCGAASLRSALEASASRNEISGYFDVESVVGLLAEMAIALALEFGNEDATIGTLLVRADISKEFHQPLIELYQKDDLGPEGNRRHSPEEFWAAATVLLEGDEEAVERLQRALSLDALTLGNVPLIDALWDRTDGGLPELAQIRREEWGILVASTGGVPQTHEGTLSVEAYVDHICAAVEDAFATQVIAQSGEIPDAGILNDFLNDHPDYDLRVEPIDAYLRRNEIEAESEVVETVKRLGRVYRLAPAGSLESTTTTLLEAGLDSAHKVVTYGRSAFMRDFADPLGSEIAEKVFNRAKILNSAAVALVARHSPRFQGAHMPMLPKQPESVDGFLSWEALFGSLDFCTCGDCQSVYSPAAYFVDLLHWVGNRRETSGLLTTRRPDLRNIELSCPNTNTPVPYIDLVNEVLELAVAPPAGEISYQTTGRAEDLEAQPENLRAEAYTKLADAVHPFELPFDLWGEEARRHLGMVDQTRAGLMEILAPEAPAEDRALETLGLSEKAWAVIATEYNESESDPGKIADQLDNLAKCWGVQTASRLSDLTSVGTLLNRARRVTAERMQFAELLELLRSAFIQRESGVAGLYFTGPACDTTQATLFVSEANRNSLLDRMHRFLRLQRRLGWSTANLDRAIEVLGAGRLDAAFLCELAAFIRLAGALRVPTEEMLSWYGPLDTRRWEGRMRPGVPPGAPVGTGSGWYYEPSLETAQPATSTEQSFYDRIFQSKVLGTEIEPAFGLNAAGTAIVGAPLSDVLVATAARLGISPTELSALASSLAITTLTLESLSVLYRNVSLARALKTRATELQAFARVANMQPFQQLLPTADSPDPAATLRFVEEYRAFQKTRFSLAELSFVVEDADTGTPRVGPAAAEVETAIGALVATLAEVAEANPLFVSEPDADPEMLRTMAENGLAKLVPADVLPAALAILHYTGEVELAPGSEDVFTQYFEPWLAEKADDPRKVLLEGLAPEFLSELPERCNYILEPLHAYFREREARAAIVAELASVLAMDTSMAEPLITNYVKTGSSPETARPVVEKFRALLDNPTEEFRESAADVFRHLHKVALIFRRFGARVDELQWLFDVGPTATGTLDLNGLIPQEKYAGWARLRDAYMLRDDVFDGEFLDLQLAATRETFSRDSLIDAIVLRTGWDAEVVHDVVYTFEFSAEDWSTEPPYLLLAEVVPLLEKLGVTADLATSWCARTVTQPIASSIKSAVRSAFNEAQWREAATPIRDELRELQRDALLADLIATKYDGGIAEVYHDLLLDPEMSACQKTSRIKQAISSVQQFVQQALLNQETGAKLNEDEKKEWEWRKNYRVWEANRKVFLYPENYIEPELRTDKTPFFEELESELSQGEITDEAAERALVNYLEKLKEVARLEIVGLYDERLNPDDPTDLLHVIGRTYSTPHRYYYRQRVRSQYWTPWETLDLEIEGDHLLPVVHNRRLYLFWPQFTEVAKEPAHKSEAKPPKYYEIRMCWSERRAGKWLPKRLSAQTIGGVGDNLFSVTERLTREVELLPGGRNRFFFAAVPDGGDLLLVPYRNLIDVHWQGVQQTGYDVTDLMLEKCFRLSSDGILAIGRPPPGMHGAVTPPYGCTSDKQGFSAAGRLRLDAPHPKRYTIVQKDVLFRVPGDFTLLPADRRRITGNHPAFFQDWSKTFFIEPLSRRPQARGVAGWTDNPELDSGQNRKSLQQASNGLLPPVGNGRSSTSVSLAVMPAQPVFTESPATQKSLLARATGPALGTLGADLKSVDGLEYFPTDGKYDVKTRGEITVRNAAGGEAKLTFLAGGTEGLHADGNVVATVFGELDASDTEVRPSTEVILSTPYAPEFRLQAFYHPYAEKLVQELNRYGVDGIYNPRDSELRRQRALTRVFGQFDWNLTKPTDTGYDYQASPFVSRDLPVESFDFRDDGAYSIYNWELFFHIPLFIAEQLTRNRRFDEARKWFHYVFDPTESSSEPYPQRCWKTKPFYQAFMNGSVDEGPIAELLMLLQDTSDDPNRIAIREQLLDSIERWRDAPFDPHGIARLRHAAYQKAVVMKYLDNLIEHGDELFRRDTLESLNEATLLYMLAARMLGRRPEGVPSGETVTATFASLEGTYLDAFSNTTVEELEAFLPDVADRGGTGSSEEPIIGSSLFFCVPPNDTLTSNYWDRVADRLFKLRNCMNLDGVVRELALFEPPIDPALLVRAAAAGVDLGSVLSDLHAPLPNHRFELLAQKATELCADVKGLGAALLAALEKRDAEELARLQNEHELGVHDAMRAVRKLAVEESKEALAGLRRSRENVELRLEYYSSRQFINAQERKQQKALKYARNWNRAVHGAELVRSVAAAVPDFRIGWSGWWPHFTVGKGGLSSAEILSGVSGAYRALAAEHSYDAQMAGITATYIRRAEDWKLQEETARKEIESLDKQILAAEIRVAMAEKEVENLDLQLKNAREVELFLKDKFTNSQLYGWMVGQLSSLYFQSYKLAFDLARKAERAFQFETGEKDSFIEFGYWDGLRKGLLAGERLHHDLKRMEVAHLEANKREYELTRHTSLRMLDPIALEQLRTDGSCIFRLPEAWFDIDSPGHYRRRIKSVALSLPSVTGPYTPVRCTLTLLSSEIRTNRDLSLGYARQVGHDPRFLVNPVGIQSIVTSRAQEDSGLFEVNLNDSRYLPFEGAGAISEWRLELPNTFRQFDYGSIADAVLHMRYTARADGNLKSKAEEHLLDALQEYLPKTAPSANDVGFLHTWDARRDFPDAWAQFAASTDPLTLPLEQRALPYALQKNVDVVGVRIDVELSSGSATTVEVRYPAGAAPTAHHLGVFEALTGAAFGLWEFTVPGVDNSAVRNLKVTFRYLPA